MATPIGIRPVLGRLLNTTRNASIPSSHLLPAIQTLTLPSQSRPFSSTPELSMRRPRRDGNRLRGQSSLYRSGLRYRMNIDKSQLPQPVNFKRKVKVDPNHGLWQFFYSKDKLLLTPDEDAQHGRGWTVEELRHKSWDDLHKLWWVCVKEQNRIATARKEKSKMRLQTGQEETADRLKEVRKTMKSIKHTLTERFYLWEDARVLAEKDSEIDLGNPEQPYTPGLGSDYLEDTGAAAAGEPEAEEVALEKGEREILAEEEPEPKTSTPQPEKIDNEIEPSTLPPSSSSSPPPPPPSSSETPAEAEKQPSAPS
ncbi:mitochondrial 39-S ribosomal protein L47 (MRP-L47)-domain-containing protein [Biscogniauxia mediterranea]|nr:mitochondrial 39-S ribosomal protein L47 (MRP-L47)-domain-containing protein [Biscogniauxia mediterranea]